MKKNSVFSWTLTFIISIGFYASTGSYIVLFNNTVIRTNDDLLGEMKRDLFLSNSDRVSRLLIKRESYA